jgi:hypothetical protein
LFLFFHPRRRPRRRRRRRPMNSTTTSRPVRITEQEKNNRNRTHHPRGHTQRFHQELENREHRGKTHRRHHLVVVELKLPRLINRNDRRTPPRGEYGIKEIKYQNSSADIYICIPAVVLFQKNIRVQRKRPAGSFFFFHQKSFCFCFEKTVEKTKKRIICARPHHHISALD